MARRKSVAVYAEKRRQFNQMMAEGISPSQAAKRLKIADSAAHRWELLRRANGTTNGHTVTDPATLIESYRTKAAALRVEAGELEAKANELATRTIASLREQAERMSADLELANRDATPRNSHDSFISFRETSTV